MSKALTTPPGADNIQFNSTRIARELRTDLLTDLKSFHEQYGGAALLAACKKECDEGRAVKLYRELIMPLFPKEDREQHAQPTAALNVINYIAADQLKSIRPIEQGGF